MDLHPATASPTRTLHAHSGLHGSCVNRHMTATDLRMASLRHDHTASPTRELH
jgi:hypothetical protein